MDAGINYTYLYEIGASNSIARFASYNHRYSDNTYLSAGIGLVESLGGTHVDLSPLLHKVDGDFGAYCCLLAGRNPQRSSSRIEQPSDLPQFQVLPVFR